MTPQDFCYWLQGFAEINGTAPTEKQWQVINDHLKLVFNKKTPDRKENVTELSPRPSTIPIQSPPYNPNSLERWIHDNKWITPTITC